MKATKKKRPKRIAVNKTAKIVRLLPGNAIKSRDRTIVYSSGKGWRWRSIAKNNKKVSNGGEWYTKLPRAIGAAYKFGARSFSIFVKTSTNGHVRAVSDAEAQKCAAMV